MRYYWYKCLLGSFRRCSTSPNKSGIIEPYRRPYKDTILKIKPRKTKISSLSSCLRLDGLGDTCVHLQSSPFTPMPCFRSFPWLYHRRQFRSQTSANMDRWKAVMGRVREKRRVEEGRSEKRKSQKRKSQKREDQRRERVRRGKIREEKESEARRCRCAKR